MDKDDVISEEQKRELLEKVRHDTRVKLLVSCGWGFLLLLEVLFLPLDRITTYIYVALCVSLFTRSVHRYLAAVFIESTFERFLTSR